MSIRKIPENMIDPNFTQKVNTHTTQLNSHTQELQSHTSQLQNHESTLNAHTSTLANHTSTLNNHTSTLNNHTGQLQNHESTLGNHTSTLNTHTSELNLLKEKTIKNTNVLHQKLLMKPFFGMGNSQIFDRAENAPQGMAYVRYQNKDLIFILSKANDAVTWSLPERQRITCFEMKTDGSYVTHKEFTMPMALTHQGISAIINGNDLYLYCGYAHGNLSNNGKGYTKIKWSGASTASGNIQTFQLIGDESSTHYLKDFNHATPCVSSDGKYVILALATIYDDSTRYVAIWDRDKVEAASDPLTVPHQVMFKVDPPPFIDSHIVQDLASDGSYIYIATSGIASTLAKCVLIYTIQGQRIGYFKVDGSLGEYTSLTNATYGTATQMEVEGITIKDDELLILTTDVWEKNGTFTRRDKHIHRIFRNTGNTDGSPLDSGKQPIESPARIHLYGARNDISYPANEALIISQWNETTREMRRSLSFQNQNQLRLYDTTVGADNENYSYVSGVRKDGRALMEIRAADTIANGSGINLYDKVDPETPGAPVILYSLDETYQNNYNVRIQETGAWRPGTDNQQNLGTGEHRWKNIYAGTDVISTSDERLKAQITDIDDRVLDAWEHVNYKQFKYIDAINEKGDENARIHIGVIAQQIIDAFEQEGLNAYDYGLIAKDEWEYQPEVRDENGVVIERERQAGFTLGIRATECLFLEMAVMRRKLDRLTQ